MKGEELRIDTQMRILEELKGQIKEYDRILKVLKKQFKKYNSFLKQCKGAEKEAEEEKNRGEYDLYRCQLELGGGGGGNGGWWRGEGGGGVGGSATEPVVRKEGICPDTTD